MIAYKDFAPTALDCKGLECDDQQEWLVAPVSRTRDSGILAESNFECLHTRLKQLDTEEGDYEIHRFNHWGPGWFEIILVRPGTACAKEAEEGEAALENYPVLDDSDYSRRECEQESECWENYGRSDFGRAIEGEFELDTDIPDSVLDRVWDKALESAPGSVYTTDEGTHFPIKEVVAYLSKLHNAGDESIVRELSKAE